MQYKQHHLRGSVREVSRWMCSWPSCCSSTTLQHNRSKPNSTRCSWVSTQPTVHKNISVTQFTTYHFQSRTCEMQVPQSDCHLPHIRSMSSVDRPTSYKPQSIYDEAIQQHKPYKDNLQWNNALPTDGSLTGAHWWCSYLVDAYEVAPVMALLMFQQLPSCGFLLVTCSNNSSKMHYCWARGTERRQTYHCTV